jgi:hypothetical protein
LIFDWIKVAVTMRDDETGKLLAIMASKKFHKYFDIEPQHLFFTIGLYQWLFLIGELCN